jgi:hypothetical protein
LDGAGFTLAPPSTNQSLRLILFVFLPLMEVWTELDYHCSSFHQSKFEADFICFPSDDGSLDGAGFTMALLPSIKVFDLILFPLDYKI